MGKFGRRFMLRAASLNSKMGNKNYYKGRGARNEGTHTTKGAYVVRQERLMTIVAPDLKGFDLKPYVHAQVPKPKRGERIPQFAAAAPSPASEMR